MTKHPHSPAASPSYPVFTPEMKKTHLILVPDMLTVHIGLILSVFESNGYQTQMLTGGGQAVVDEGLKNVHNDTCYPALLVIGQFMNALKSGKYDPNRIALLLPQTGGGCRASNYISLLRKALRKSFPQVPVISLNFSGLEADSSIEVDLKVFLSLLDAVFYADILMLLYNQCKPYEVIEGQTDAVRAKWNKRLSRIFKNKGKHNRNAFYRKILKEFGEIERKSVTKPKVGIIGEIYVKYSALANNSLENFLLTEGCEPVVPLLSEFILYATTAGFVNAKLYGHMNSSIVRN
ncbi:MAG: 2-hydroxyacyl-CoA dehydratase, partial [Oscillospiraceae bacterium]|nr:2-hydroxyacyl-CoA dehydratase [Oscillospiraceae bacterium]